MCRAVKLSNSSVSMAPVWHHLNSLIVLVCEVTGQLEKEQFWHERANIATYGNRVWDTLLTSTVLSHLYIGGEDSCPVKWPGQLDFTVHVNVLTISASHACARQKWVMIPDISTSESLAFFRAERLELTGRAQINTMVISGSAPQKSHNIEPPTPLSQTHTHTHY